MNTSRILHTALLLWGVLAAGGNTQTLIYHYRGTGGGDRIGSSVAALGDVDRDGVPDFAIGAPSSCGSCPRSHVDVYSGADGRLLWRVQSARGARFGAAIASADVNKDGVSDVVIGDPDANQGAGGVFVHSGADGTLLRRFVRSKRAGYTFADAVAGAGDVNGDGYEDVAVGQHTGVTSIPTFVHIYSGKDFSVLRTIGAKPGNYTFGSTVAGGADLSGDGVPDLLVGQPGANLVHAYSGADGKRILVVGGRPRTSFGASVSFAGDVNRDGRADFVVGAGFHRDVLVFSGKDGSVLRTLTGGSPFFGRDVAAAGDADGDGYPDLIVGDGALKEAVVFSGKDGRALARIRDPGSSPSRAVAVAGIGDLNGDGSGEVVVGFDRRGAGNAWGIARVYSARFVATFRLGRGCGAGTPPRLDATVRGRGKPMTLSIRSARPGRDGFQLVGLPTVPLPLTSTCAVYLHPLAHAVVARLRTSASGTWTHTLQVPATVARDSQVVFQALVLAPRTPLGLELTNGVLTTFR